jgi:monomeric isocitrate dehydrogenase
MVVFSSELLAYYDLTFIILVSTTAQGRGIQAVLFLACIAVSVTTPRDKPVASLPTVCGKTADVGSFYCFVTETSKKVTLRRLNNRISDEVSRC